MYLNSGSVHSLQTKRKTVHVYPSSGSVHSTQRERFMFTQTMVVATARVVSLNSVILGLLFLSLWISVIIDTILGLLSLSPWKSVIAMPSLAFYFLLPGFLSLRCHLAYLVQPSVLQRSSEPCVLDPEGEPFRASF